MSVVDDVNEMMVKEMIGGAIDSMPDPEAVKEKLNMFEDIQDKLPDDMVLMICKIDGEASILVSGIDHFEFTKKPTVINLLDIIKDIRKEQETEG